MSDHKDKIPVSLWILWRLWISKSAIYWYLKALVYWYDKNMRFVRSIVQTLIWNEYWYDLASEEKIEREEGERVREEEIN